MQISERINNGIGSFCYETIIAGINSVGKLSSFAIGLPIYYLFRSGIDLVATNMPSQTTNILFETYININRALLHQFNISVPQQLLNPDNLTTSFIKDSFAKTNIIDTLLPNISINTALQATAIEMAISVIISALICLLIDLYQGSNHPANILRANPDYNLPADSSRPSQRDEWRSFRRRLTAIRSLPIGAAIAGIWLNCSFYEILMLTFINGTGLSVLSLLVEPSAIAGREIYAKRQANIHRASIIESVEPSLVVTSIAPGVVVNYPRQVVTHRSNRNNMPMYYSSHILRTPDIIPQTDTILPGYRN